MQLKFKSGIYDILNSFGVTLPIVCVGLEWLE